MRTKNQTITLVFFKTYLAVIKNSIGTNMFRTFYARKGSETTDVLEKGNLSCAFYVSSLLLLFKLVKSPHLTVSGLVQDLKTCGWKATKKPNVGDILVWERVALKGGESHKHVGFYIGNGKAISNNYKKGHPVVHSWNFNGKRKVESIFSHKKLHKNHF